MTPAQVRIVQRTWIMVLPAKEAAAQIFYERLFEIDPSLPALFPHDMRMQRTKLMQVMDAVVNGLGRQQQFLPIVQALGRRHAGYGVKNEHYGAVGAALLWMLGEVLGSAFTPEVRDAWTTVYALLARTMRAAAADPQT